MLLSPRFTRYAPLVVCGWIVLAGAAVADPGATSSLSNSGLLAVHAEIEDDYPGVAQLSATAMREQVETRRTVIFDVREPEEFAVSRIPGAIRMDPGTSRREFRREHVESVRGRDVVFYCSVGVRSSRMATRMRKELRRAGARRIYNLAGGVFEWHNRRMPLASDDGATDYVHPYDDDWGRLLNRRDQARHEPSAR